MNAQAPILIAVAPTSPWGTVTVTVWGGRPLSQLEREKVLRRLAAASEAARAEPWVSARAAIVKEASRVAGMTGSTVERG